MLVGILTMTLCLLFQTGLILLASRYYRRREQWVNNPSFLSSLVVVHGVMLLLVIGNIVQLTIWAMLFFILGEFESVTEAIYHSAVNFSTLGYGDIVMSDTNKVLGPLEAINGVLMIGVSTAVLTTTFQDSMRKTMQARQV
jgi:hypothetical protein